MIVGIGIDLVNIQRIGKIYSKHGERFVNRILTDQEKDEFIKHKNREISFLAKRLSTKEAFVKALGTGFTEHIFFNSIGTHHNKYGKPQLHCANKIQRLLDHNKINKVHLSVSDDENYAISNVVFESISN